MPGAHRFGDSRACGASTIVVGNQTVFVNGRLWAVKGDIDTHEAGGLINTTGHTVFNQGIPVIVLGDKAEQDMLGHVMSDDEAASASGDTFAYG